MGNFMLISCCIGCARLFYRLGLYPGWRMVVRPEDSRGRKRARQRNRFLPEMLRSWSPPHKVGAPFSIFRDGPFGGFGNVRHNRIRMTFAKPPDLQPTPDAARQQRPTCLKLGIRCLVDQHRAAVADAIALTPLAP